MTNERQPNNSSPDHPAAPSQPTLNVRAKIVAYRIAGGLGRVTRGLLSKLPFLSRMLNVPTGRISSLRKWVEDYRRRVPWDQRRTAAHYRRVRRPMRASASAPPRSLVPNDVPAVVWLRDYDIHHELFLASIPHARVLGPNGVVITPDDKIAEESAWIGDGWLEQDRARRALHLPKPEALEGHYFTIASFDSQGYAHWILDALPRLSLLRYATPQTKVIVSQLAAQWQRDSLTHLGLNLDELVVLGNRHLALELLHVPSYIGQPGRIHPSAVNWLRKKFLTGEQSLEAGKRLYLTRRGGRRHVINEDELEPILRRFDFEIINSGEFSFADQIELFSRAEAIAGPHGAALTNSVFAPAACKIFELFAPTCVRPMYYQLASVIGQSYWYLVGRENSDARETDRGFDNMWISPEEFERTLSDMFS
ncbi:MAG: glycosyltransferase family 61 protein [Pyrinomonadaceae bacterium]